MLIREFFNGNAVSEQMINQIFDYILNHDDLHREEFWKIADEIKSGEKSPHIWMPIVRRAGAEFIESENNLGSELPEPTKEIYQKICQRLMKHYRTDILNDVYHENHSQDQEMLITELETKKLPRTQDYRVPNTDYVVRYYVDPVKKQEMPYPFIVFNVKTYEKDGVLFRGAAKTSGEAMQQGAEFVKSRRPEIPDWKNVAASSVSIDFNRLFTNEILNGQTEFMAGLIQIGGEPKLVILPDVEDASVGHVKGLRKAIPRHTSVDGQPGFPGISITTNHARELGLAPNGRYSVVPTGKKLATGEELYDLVFDSIVTHKEDRKRMESPSITIAVPRK